MGQFLSSANSQLAALKVKGFGLGLSTAVPLGGGTALFGVSYLDAEYADSTEKSFKNILGADFVDWDLDLTRWTVSAGYAYPLSKRTQVYAAATYMQDKIKGQDDKVKPNVYGAMFGLRHNF